VVRFALEAAAALQSKVHVMQVKLLVILVASCGLVSIVAAQPASAVWGTAGMSGVYAWVTDLAVYDDGTGPALYRCGYAGGGVKGVWRWDGNTWTIVGLASSWCNALGVYDDGTGSKLYLAGQFNSVDGVPANCIASWDGTTWSALGSGLSGGSSGTKPYALTVFDDGTGSALYVGGEFASAGGVASPGVARWNGAAWSAPAPAVPFNSGSVIRAFTIHDDGTGPALYCGGYFGIFIGGNLTRSIVRYDGSTWSALGQGFKIGANSGTIYALASFDEGAGARLFAGGYFDDAPGCSFNGSTFARWDGACWTEVGGGVGGSSGCTVTALEVFDDGTGPALYIGGKSLWWAGSPSTPAWSVARWRNGAYEALGGGIYLQSAGSAEVTTLEPFDDGEGLDLYAAGSFTHADFIPTGCVARFGGRSPTVQLSQPAGPGAPVLITDSDFMPGREYYNIFSLETCPGPPGSGPYIGLCTSYLQGLFDQFNLPLGIPPFHFEANARTQTFGPFALPPGISIDVVCFDWTNQEPVAISPVFRLTVL
jgi:hypothetical protein